MYLEFKDETLLPKMNGEVYFAIYELENWLRRICMTAWMATFGSTWIESLPPKFHERFKQRIAKNRDLFYLDADSDDNLIWMATHGELKEMLLDHAIVPQVEKYTGLPRERLSQKLDELRDIRNLLAHNRALSNTTEVIVNGIVASLRLAIGRFKGNMFYPFGADKVIIDDDEQMSQHFNARRESYFENLHAYVAFDEDFYHLNCLPMERREQFPSAAKLLKAYGDQLKSILAFAISKDGDEYSLIVPRVVPKNDLINIVDKFFASQYIWTTTSFDMQHPKYACHPKIWFYGSSHPVDE